MSSASPPEATVPADVERLAITTIRALAIDAAYRSGASSATAHMALAPLAYRLFTRHLRHDPSDPTWPDRDRFVLSAGDGAMLLYAVLHLSGYDLDVEDLEGFRELDSRTPAYPEYGETPGVEATTGPFGEGFANAVGMALAERMLAARYNRDGHQIVDHRTWVIVNDGDLMQGVVSEAAVVAGSFGLERLIVCYDATSGVDRATTGDVEARFRAYGWRTLAMPDAEDLDAIDAVIREASSPCGRPTLILVGTESGVTVSVDTSGGEAGDGGARAAKQSLGWPYADPFTVPDAVDDVFDQHARGASMSNAWDAAFDRYREDHPELGAEFMRVTSGLLPDGWEDALPTFDETDAEATRTSSRAVVNALARVLPELIAGSAALPSSRTTLMDDVPAAGAGRFEGRTLDLGVREHGLAAILSGIALHGGFRVFAAVSLAFTDYCRPAMRLAALMGIPVIYVADDDSIALGQDGPTHQPVEQLAALRAVPNLSVVRPADARETVGAWREAIARQDGPTVLALTRQPVPAIPGTDPARVGDGAYVLDDDDADPDVVLLATGSDVQFALEAQRLLALDEIVARVVTMPSWEYFDDTDDEYQDDVLPPDIPVLSVEAATTFGWERWADESVGVDDFGASAPPDQILERYGLTGAAVADAAVALLEDDSPGDDATNNDDEDEQ